MKYKTLFLLLLKAIGVFILVQGLATLIPDVISLIRRAIEDDHFEEEARILYYLDNFIEIAIGLYLIFGGKWIVNKAIPSNRPYCNECGYELRNLTNNQCPECGTPVQTNQTTSQATEAIPEN